MTIESIPESSLTDSPHFREVEWHYWHRLDSLVLIESDLPDWAEVYEPQKWTEFYLEEVIEDASRCFGLQRIEFGSIITGRMEELIKDKFA